MVSGEKCDKCGWRWKWVDMEEEGGGLFDLSDDLGERDDLSLQHPEVLKRLKQRFGEWYQETMFDAEPRGPFKDF